MTEEQPPDSNVTSEAELRRANEQLRRSDEAYRTLVENLPALVCRFLPDGTLTFVNQLYCTTFNRRPEELIGANFFQFIPEGERERVRAHYSSLAPDRPTITYAHQVLSPDGEVRWQRWTDRGIFDERGKPVEYQSVGEDITEYKRMGRTLRESERKYRELIERATDGILIVQDSMIRFANGRLAEMWGGTVEEMIDTPFMRYVDPADVSRVVDYYRRRMAGKEAPPTYELVMRHKDGHGVHLECNAGTTMYHSRPAVLAFVRDVTDRKRLEEELRQVQKMEALGRLAAGVAHDFNNLLTAIVGYGQMMLRRLPSDDPHRPFVQEIVEAGHRATSLTRQLLLFSRKEAPQRVAVDLNELVEGVMSMLGRVIGEDVSVVTDLAPQLHQLEADPGHLEQVILNLAVNARDAMPQGGMLTIKTENVAEAEVEHPHRSGLGSGRFVHLSVADTGLGMDEEARGRIFEPFFTTKEEGTGLGLAVAYGIVQEHGGWIDVDSAPCEGTTIHIYLPAAEPEPAEGGEERPREAEASGGDGRGILVVEDDGDVREFLARVLTDRGYAVFEASSVEEAVGVFQRQEDRIDLVFCDVILPDGTGLALAGRLLSRRGGLRILMGTGYLDDRVLPADVAERGITLLRKPYSIPELLRAIGEVLQGD